MPTVLRLRGCEWRIYTDDHFPPHAHVKVGDGMVVINLDEDASIKKATGVKASERSTVQQLTKENLTLLLDAWIEIHGSVKYRKVKASRQMEQQVYQPQTTTYDELYEDRNDAVAVEVSDDKLIITTRDGRVIHVPVDWFPWLASATPAQRTDFTNHGTSIHWNAFDEGVSMQVILLGRYNR